MGSELKPTNESVHVRSLAATKIGDGLIDPKLVLAWLLMHAGAGSAWIGFLVPVREAGALLPQLLTAEQLRKVAIKKWWWVAGSALQGVAVLGIFLAGQLFNDWAAGASILGCILVFALARSVCSVSHKDLLGKTVIRNRRGFVSGRAASAAAIGVLMFGIILHFSLLKRETIVFAALFFAGLLWFASAIQFSFLDEEPSRISAHSEPSVWKRYVRIVATNSEFQKYILSRSLLTSTAIAPPFILLLAEDSDVNLLFQLGELIIVSSLATSFSAVAWGKLSDHSTQLVLVVAGISASFFLSASVLIAYAGWIAEFWALPILLFANMVAYQGVRIGRMIHLVNLADEQTRAAYTAIANTIIGIVLLGTGIFGVLAASIGAVFVVAALALMSLAGAAVALSFRMD